MASDSRVTAGRWEIKEKRPHVSQGERIKTNNDGKGPIIRARVGKSDKERLVKL